MPRLQRPVYRPFQSAPRAGARGDAPILKLGTRRTWVSIRSPRGCAGRCWTASRPANPRSFQSAPRAGARGDVVHSVFKRTPKRFNPLPARVRGEIMATIKGTSVVYVSIRSPRGCAGRSARVATSSAPKLFQSAPRAGARGDDHRERADHQIGCFNPLPARVRGEIRNERRRGAVVLEFQSAPRAGARGDRETFS